MAPILRATLAGLLLAALEGSVGCGPRPDRTVIYQIRTSDYDVDFDGYQKKATIASGSFLIVREPEDIRVSGGMLKVGTRKYGAVALKDKIRVVGGKVAVNGRERTPSDP